MHAMKVFYKVERCNMDTVTHYTACYCYHVSLLLTSTANSDSCWTHRYTLTICFTRLHVLHLSRI